MNYYIEQEGKIVLVDTDKAQLERTLAFTPQYAGLEIQETQRPIENFEFADTPEYIAKKAAAEKAARVEELKEQLNELDLKSLRALRAMQAGTGTEADRVKLAELEAQSAEIRRQLQELAQ